MTEPNWKALNQFMAQPEPTPPRFEIRGIKLATPYTPPELPQCRVEYTYGIFDTLTGEFLQAVEDCSSPVNAELVRLCALLNGATVGNNEPLKPPTRQGIIEAAFRAASNVSERSDT